MSVCMNTSTTPLPSVEDSNVFESQIMEVNDREKILFPHIESRFHSAALRFNIPPMSAPPIVKRNFQFGVDSSLVNSSFDDKSTKWSNTSGNRNFGGIALIPPKKTRSKSLSFVQPACGFLKQCHERKAKNSCCPTVNPLPTLEWRLQCSLCDRSSEGFPFNTLRSEKPFYPNPLGAVESIQIGNSAEVSLPSRGSLINVPTSPVIGIISTPERGYSPGRICRICHDGTGALISPCLCMGTVALIHKECLERWLTQINSCSCEICQFNYRVERRPMAFYKVFSDSTNTKLRRSILTDLACFVGLTPLAIAAICLCLLGAMQVFQNMATDVSVKLDPAVVKAEEATRRWEAGWLIFLAVMLLLVYIIWFSCTFNSHMKTWAQWRLVSLQVKLLDVKRPCQNKIEASDDVPLAPIRLMMDDATITSSDESTLTISIANSRTRAQLSGSSSSSAALLDEPAQDVSSIIGILVNDNST